VLAIKDNFDAGRAIGGFLKLHDDWRMILAHDIRA
jgi:hypothetical protein